MELKHLEAFAAVLEEGSISAAARSLRKGQPQISQWLSDLETDLNIELFKRTGNRSEPTEKAYTVLPYVRKLLCAQNELVEITNGLSCQVRHHLTLAIDEWIPALPVSAPVSEFLLMHPEITVEIHSFSRCEIIQGIKKGELDIALVSEVEDHHPTLSYQRIGFYDDIYVAGPDFISQIGSQISMDQLARQRELVWSIAGSTVSSKSLTISDAQALSSHFAQITDLELLKSMLRRNCGYALLPKQIVKQELENGQLVELTVAFEQVAMKRRVELIWRTGSDACPSLKALLLNIQNDHAYSH
ncbi:LysR family transcriptional regulator [Endozoicomonas atrinae]|uniref:LysR family transcriptional regulator n=1 Tax=Endozoicomonas atrinae TaxID=1333660 RepID=UPI000825CC1B|nr:LysR family transcriptional regulator [Endozoicomonas atrinae]